MALSGNLDFVPLDEVLRLLTRAEQQAAVQVAGDQLRGRIFISRRGIGLATTADDDTLRGHLINSGYVDDAYLRKVEAGEASLVAGTEDHEGGIIGLLREMTIESIYQLSHNGTSFEVTEGATSPYTSPSPFDLEVTLDDSKRRGEQWAEVSRVVADLNTIIRMNRDIGDDRDRVEISREAWKLLSEMGSGASINTMVGRLGTTEFWTAKVASEMADRGLLIVEGRTESREPDAEREEPVEEARPDESWWQEPSAPGAAEEPEEEYEVEAPAAEVEAPAAEVEAPAAEVEEPEQTAEAKSERRFFGQFAPSRSETLAYQPVESADEEEEGEEEHGVEEPAADESQPFESEVSPLTGDDLEAVEEDTEAFLEKVFSELESDEQSDEEGHGLLRRRRMGSVLKELGED